MNGRISEHFKDPKFTLLLHTATVYIPSFSRALKFGIYADGTTKKPFFNLHGRTVHVDNINSFICPTNAHTNYFKIMKLLKSFKNYNTCSNMFRFT